MKSKYLAAAALAAFACTAGAQSLKPGLWEINQKMQASGAQGDRMAQMQQQMANMPPEQRKMMEEMMARQGVKMGPGGPGGGGMSIQMCMTKEMAERREVPAQRGDCKTTQQSMSGKTMKMAFTCTNPPSSGEGEVTFSSPESYSMKMAVTTQVQGQSEKVNMDATGKWLGADCGNVRPMGPPARK
jgi:hypothetical protein